MRMTRPRARVRAPEKDQIKAVTLLSLGGHQIDLVRIRMKFQQRLCQGSIAGLFLSLFPPLDFSLSLFSSLSHSWFPRMFL